MEMVGHFVPYVITRFIKHHSGVASDRYPPVQPRISNLPPGFTNTLHDSIIVLLFTKNPVKALRFVASMWIPPSLLRIDFKVKVTMHPEVDVDDRWYQMHLVGFNTGEISNGKSFDRQSSLIAPRGPRYNIPSSRSYPSFPANLPQSRLADPKLVDTAWN